MKKETVNQLAFQDVYQKNIRDDRIEIHFNLNKSSYYIVIDRKEDQFEPWGVFHNKEKTERVCTHCDNTSKHLCMTLDDHVETIFYRLIELPNIRLEWLFIPYRNE